MTDLEAKETIEDLHAAAVADTVSLKTRIKQLEAELASDRNPYEGTEPQLRRLEDRLVVKGLHVEALAIALTKF